MKLRNPIIIAGSVVLLDQISKILVKVYMHRGQTISVIGDWFKLHFTENYGMAFGLEFGGEIGKLFLTVFRLIAAGLISYYIYTLVKQNASKGYIYALCLILGGALGNIIDSVFYGVIFGEAPLLFGKVVDMLYFPLWRGHLPEWIPFWGGNYFIFFRPIFNIADSAITIGVFSILLFYRDNLKNL